jgi:transposase
MRSRIEAMKKVAQTLCVHRELILNYFRARKEFSSGVIVGSRPDKRRLLKESARRNKC